MKLLTAIAIGDAVGRPFEFATPTFIKNNNNLSYVLRKGETLDKLGTYTDDTQQSIAIAKSMLTGLGSKTTHAFYSIFLIAAYRANPIQGYSKRMSRKLADQSSPQFLGDLTPIPSNGCAMRTLPIGLYPTISEVRHAAIIAASTSHPHEEGINSSLMLSLAAHYFYYKLGPKKDLIKWLEIQMGRGLVADILEAHQPKEKIECNAKQTVAFCIKAVLQEGSMSKLLRRSINIGGDVDSTAAICMGLASLMGMKDDLPKELSDNLEYGEYGQEFISKIEELLYKKYPAVKKS